MACTSTFAAVAPDGSVTRPVSVAVGLANTVLARKIIAAATRIRRPPFIEVCSPIRGDVSRVIRILRQCGEEKLLAGRLVVSAGALDRDEDLIDLREYGRI